MPARNLILTGVPRGGTTLCCHLLNRAPDTIALFEPIPVDALPIGAAAVDFLRAYFQSTRQGLQRSGQAPSYRSADGRIPDNPAADRPGQPRRWQVEHGMVQFDAPASQDFTLAIKHNASFTALLPQLHAQFETLAIVRHPLAVLASWSSLELAVSAGRAPAGERQDVALVQALDRQVDAPGRQIVLLDWFFQRYLQYLPAQRVLRYEDLVESQGRILYRALDLPDSSMIAPLQERNANPVYRSAILPRLAERLLASDGAYWHWYPRDSVMPLLERMQATP